jgi:hypothetical protein
MGYMRHHAIIVTSWDKPLLKSAYAKANELGMLVTNIVEDTVNSYGSFLVAPDGSKEGWEESLLGETRRAMLIRWLDAQRYDDDSTMIDWVEVQYGDDEHQTLIVRDSDERIRDHG